MNGVDLHFVCREEFEEEIRRGLFVEFGEYQGDLYGTSKRSIVACSDRENRITILNLSPEGLKSLKYADLFPFVIYFHLPKKIEQLIQFTYGEDGLAGENVEFQSILSFKPSNNLFERLCRFDLSQGEKSLRKYFTDDVIRDLYKNESLEILDEEWKQLNDDRHDLREVFPTGDTSKIVLPCNSERLIYNAKKTFHLSNRNQSNLSPMEVIRGIQQLTQRLIVVKGDDRLSHEAQSNATMLMKILLRSALSSRQVLETHRLTDVAFQCFVEK